jgi:CHASE2 domain-containing sensor protein
MVEDMRKIKKHARTTPQKAAASAWGAASKAALAGWSGTGLAMLLTEWWWTPYLSPLLFFISVVCATISVMKKSSIDADRRPPSIRP